MFHWRLDVHYKSCYIKSSKSWPWSQFDCATGERLVKLMAQISLYVLGGGRVAGLGGWCERSCGGMRQRGYQFVEGFLCPISSVKGHVPRVLTLVTSLASSLPRDPGSRGIYYYPPAPRAPSPTALPMEENKTPPSLSPPAVPQPRYMY